MIELPVIIGLFLLMFSLVACDQTFIENERGSLENSITEEIYTNKHINENNGMDTEIYNGESFSTKLERFIDTLQKSEFKRTSQEAGYECLYEGEISFENYTLYYNQTDFSADNFIHMVLVDKQGQYTESVYNVDLSSSLANEFQQIIDLWEKQTGQ